MNEPEVVEFSLNGTIAGDRISATEGLPLSQFVDFNEEVQRYVQGSDGRAVLQSVKVQIHEGSYLLRVLIPLGLLPSLIADTAKVAKTGSAADIDLNRAKVVLRWQERAKMDPSLVYQVHSPEGTFESIIISHSSNFVRQNTEQWVNIERYVIGEITDWGGAQTINVHVRPRNSKDVLIVAATADQIREQRENLVFHKAIVHVRAKLNPKTGVLKDYKLVELRAYGPQVEDERLQKLFQKGASAWADVPQGSRWVDELRGGSHG